MIHLEAIDKILSQLKGSFDNFQQFWQENTEEEIHANYVDKPHQHIHLKFVLPEDQKNTVEIHHFTGRNNEEIVGKLKLSFEITNNNKIELIVDNQKTYELELFEQGFKTIDPFLSLNADSLEIHGLNIYENEIAYKLKKCRYFDGWLQCPVDGKEDEFFELRGLQIHDQGGMAQIQYQDEVYTAELTQLVFAHKIHIMKLAIYDLPISEIGINSKAISYTWSNPEVKRIGINLRKIISGWTYIEAGYLNSTNLQK